MKVINTEFITGAVSSKQYPKGSLPEFAFVGRSNVGKSSLIRSLLNRKKLVRISSSPGKTREINFFRINEKLIFADLPGYGFARVTPALQKQWKNKQIQQNEPPRHPTHPSRRAVPLRRGVEAPDGALSANNLQLRRPGGCLSPTPDYTMLPPAS